MSSIKNNVKKTIINLLEASSALVEVSSELVVDGSSLVVTAVKQVRPVSKELIHSPLSAYKGYLVEQGMDEAEAKAKAFKVLEQDLSSAVRKGSEATGKALAAMLEGWDEEDTK